MSSTLSYPNLLVIFSDHSTPPMAAHQPFQLCSFLNRAETEIRSNDHATALIGALELGCEHLNGINGAFWAISADA
jgi:hypothetical protein